jgi:hypothetical protein
MYSRIAEEEDNKMVECSYKDTDGTLIFVSPHIKLHLTPHINWET